MDNRSEKGNVTAAIGFIIASVIANAAIGGATGWACGWLLGKAGEHDSLLWGAAMIPVMAAGLFIAVMAAAHPAIAAVFLVAMAGAMFAVVALA